MGVHRRWVAASLAAPLISGCQGSTGSTLAIPEGAQSMLLAIENGNALIKLTGVEPLDGVTRLVHRHGEHLTVLLYPLGLGPLGIDLDANQAVILAAPGDPGRRLPQPTWIFDDDRGAPLTESATLSQGLQDVRLSSVDVVGCANRGGCFDPPRGLSCKLPCPEPVAPKGPADPEPPVAPSLPNLEPCPSGWAAAPPDAVAPQVGACEPPAILPRAAGCSASEVQPYGERTCQRIGSACPAGDFASFPAGTVYVKAGAAANGNGSLGAPFATIAQAVMRAAPGSTIAISRGTFSESLAIDKRLTLSGACVSGTLIQATGTALEVRSTGVVVKNLRLESGDVAILQQPGSGSLAAVDCAIHATGRMGWLAADGNTVEAHRVVIRGSGEVGLYANNAQVSLQDFTVEDATGRGLWILGPSSVVSATRLVTRDLAEFNGGNQGVLFDQSVRATVQNVEVARVFGAGFQAAPSAQVQVDDLSVEDIRESQRDHDAGYGVWCEGSAVMGQRIAVRRTRSQALTVLGGAHVAFTDLWSSDSALPHRAHVVVVVSGATLELRRAVLQDTWSSAFYADGQSDALLEDVWLRRAGTATVPTSGLQIATGASVRVRRGLFTEMGSLTADVVEGSGLELTDFTALRGGPGEAETTGIRLGTATATITRARLIGVRAGVELLPPARASISDLEIRCGERMPDASGLLTAGVLLEASRIQVSHCLPYGLLAYNSLGTPIEVRLSDARFDPPPATAGDGIQVRAPVTLTGSRIAITGERNAVWMVHPLPCPEPPCGSIALSDLSVRSSTNGVLGESFQVSLARVRLEQVRNGLSLDNGISEISDLLITDPGSAAGGNISLVEPKAFELSRFDLSPGRASGIRIQRRGPVLDIEDGTIHDGSVGLVTSQPLAPNQLQRVLMRNILIPISN